MKMVHHSSTPYIEMLVPRRKGQLVKLLILIPLSLLLLTSIYYQFCYEQPSIERQPMSAMLVNEIPMDQKVYDADDSSIRSNFSNKRHYNNDESDTIDEDIRIPSDARNSETRTKDDSYSNNPQNEPKPSSSQTNDDVDHRIANHSYKSRDKSRTLEQQNIINHQRIATAGQISDSTKDKHKKDEHYLIEQNDDSHMSHRAKPNGMRLSFDSSYIDNKRISHNDDRVNPDLTDQETKKSETHIESDLLREEEADAQDAAVIPAPSEPNGPGELGRPVVLKNLTKQQQDMVNVGWENNAFNQFVSDIISVNRSLPDVRDPSCKNVKYPDPSELPPTSVIVCFHNEAWSVLLRTVHSIINRSPKHLVKEIILVDDFSNKPHLGQQLEDYMKALHIVKIVRATRREGLIRARLLGAQASTAPVLTFLDSHCECAEGWLEPLLTRIYQDTTTVVCPVIDVISDKTFEYHYKGDANSVSVGGFDWNLQFNWHSIPDREKKRRKHSYDPIRSPTMAGGLFSIDKAFFERLGTYDSGFDIWGGENLELSFKTWMCGGKLEILPCSHVGHVFRSRSPYKWRTGVNVLKRNSVRLAEVWMDDYKKYYYDRIGHELGDYGDVTERLELRKRLQCKPFSYFVKNVYPELFIPGEAVAYGEVRNEAQGNIKMCLDSAARKTDFHKPLGVYPCHGAGGNQYWLLSRDGEIRRDEACVDYAGHDVVLFPCHGSGGNQMWFYEKDTKQIRHSTSGRCMELALDRIRIRMSDCDSTSDAQRWTFQHYNASLATTNSKFW